MYWPINFRIRTYHWAHVCSLIFNLDLVPSCLINYDFEPLSLDLELHKIINLASSLDHLCDTSPSYDLLSLDQHAHTLYYLEIRLAISLDNIYLEHFI
ncbi:hypothetical protein Tco_0581743 [Tanacetum coccineum]